MEIKEHFTLETKKGEQTFTFHMPKGATWGNAIDAAFDFLKHINELSQNAVQAMRPAEEEAK